MNIISVKYLKDQNDQNIAYQANIDGIIYDIPFDESNRHYQAILEWVENGGVIVDNGA